MWSKSSILCLGLLGLFHGCHAKGQESCVTVIATAPLGKAVPTVTQTRTVTGKLQVIVNRTPVVVVVPPKKTSYKPFFKTITTTISIPQSTDVVTSTTVTISITTSTSTSIITSSVSTDSTSTLTLVGATTISTPAGFVPIFSSLPNSSAKRKKRNAAIRVCHTRPDNNNSIDDQDVDLDFLGQYVYCLVNFVDYQYNSVNNCYYVYNYCVNTDSNSVYNNLAGSDLGFGIQGASVPFAQGYYQAFSGSSALPMDCCSACAALPLCAMSEFKQSNPARQQCLLIMSTHATCAFGDYTGQALISVNGQTIAADTGHN
ncbi:hypothetical protein F52700_3236 [Fusarium sp. NRRL 52700]|nr:hypothetical protein F52700_3236 [Fusarium sp. NRRL 52700]